MKAEFILRKSDKGWANTAAYKEHLRQLPSGSYLFKIDSTKKRSLPQNAYYWSVVVPLVYQGLKDAGYDTVRNTDDTHEIMKGLFLKVVEEKNGLTISRVLSTGELKTVGYMEYLQHISTWAFDYLNVTIPEPNQQIEFNL